jgi:hypothetical protein
VICLRNHYDYEPFEEFIIPPGHGADLVERGINDIASGNSWITPDGDTNSDCPGQSPFDLAASRATAAGRGHRAGPRSRCEEAATWRAS